MNFSEIFAMMSGGVPFYILAFIIVLSILVFVHEWGHYIVARMCGVRVETFSIGFGRELFGRYDKNGTRWKMALIPLGGYVKLYGDVDPASAGHDENVADGETIRQMTEAEKKQAFFAQSVWKRAAIVFAGPAINYIFAFILLTMLFTTNGQPVTPPIAGAVVGGSAAERAGFMPQDKVISIDGKQVYDFNDIRREMMIALDTDLTFNVERDGQEISIDASPDLVTSTDRFGFKQSRGVLGLISPRHALRVSTISGIDGQSYDVDDIDGKLAALDDRMGQTFSIEIYKGEEEDADIFVVSPLADANANILNKDDERYGILFMSPEEGNVFVKHTPIRAMGEAINQSWVVTRGTVEALGQMITGTRSATELGGVIRIGALAGDMAKQGLVALIMFMALLSINLGLINLFPIPMLDGGHLVFYAIEAVMRRPVSERVQEYAFRVGLVFLVGIMAFANLNDLMQLFLKT